MTYLLDTSVLTRLRVDAVRARLGAADAAGLARTTITALEIGFSARNSAEWDDLQHALATFRALPVLAHHLDRALQVQRLLADRGLRGRAVPDLVMAAVAEAEALTVLHYDADYDHIASVTHQPVEWVVARGVID